MVAPGVPRMAELTNLLNAASYRSIGLCLSYGANENYGAKRKGADHERGS
jgi:hypothetical protein